MPARPASAKKVNARYNRFTRELAAAAGESKPVEPTLSEKYGLVWRGPRAVEVLRNGRAVRKFGDSRSAVANWNAALAWAQAEERKLSQGETYDES